MNSMAWLALLVWVGVPVMALLTGALLWRRSRSQRGRALALMLSATVLFTPVLVSSGVKGYYDREVREMCAKDGGIRVYESVRLPASRFDKWGNVGIPNKRYTKPSDEYFFESDDHYLRYGNPKLLRVNTRLIRRNDEKVLGESIRYARSRGDLPGPWFGSSFDCPAIADAEGKLESSIFLKRIEK